LQENETKTVMLG